MDPSIFKAYDVRGVYGEQLDGDDAYRIGRAFARVLGDEEGKQPPDLRVGLGRDMRLTAPEMPARYADGLRDGARTWSTSGWSGPRCCISRSARTISTAA